jgi:hypothetical protein
MVHQENQGTGGQESSPQIKQVEFNTIASSFGGLSALTSSLHRCDPSSTITGSRINPPQVSRSYRIPSAEESGCAWSIQPARKQKHRRSRCRPPGSIHGLWKVRARPRDLHHLLGAGRGEEHLRPTSLGVRAAKRFQDPSLSPSICRDNGTHDYRRLPKAATPLPSP